MKRPLAARASEPKTCHLQLGQPVRSMPLVSAFSSLVASGPAAPAAAPQSNRKSTACKVAASFATTQSMYSHPLNLVRLRHYSSRTQSPSLSRSPRYTTLKYTPHTI